KSNSVAKVMVVSSTETLSTQSNSSPIGSESRIFPARSRMMGARYSRLPGETIGLTTLRCASCLGGSIAMNIGSLKSSLGSTMVMDGSDEKSAWLVSTAMMSLYLVTDH